MNICGVGHFILGERNCRVFEEMAKYTDVKIIVPVRQNPKLALRLMENNVIVIDGGFFIPHTKIPFAGGILTSYMPKTVSIIKKIKGNIDILYTMMEPFGLITATDAFFSKKYGIKHAFFTWENIDHKFFGLKKILSSYSYEKLFAASLKYSDGIIAGNKEAVSIMKSRGFNKKIEILPQTGVDTDLFNPKVYPKYKEKFNLMDKIVVLFAGNVTYEKGLSFLVNSIPDVIKVNKNVHFLICGDGSMKMDLIKYTESKGLEKHVTFMNRVKYDEMPYVHASADIFVYPSIPTHFWKEQFGFSIVEAMSTEKPVVVTNAGAMPEIVENNKTGFIVEPKNSKALSEAILELANKKKLRVKFGKKGRMVVEKKYSVEVVAKKTFEFFNSLFNF
jgi:glycosyltransferase involved in cell wall biosynthesis